MKIIRDRLIKRIPAAAITIASPQECKLLLAAKISEERDEIVASNFSDAFEFADCLEALQALAEQSGISWADILDAQTKKRHTHGGFADGIVYHQDRDPTRGQC